MRCPIGPIDAHGRSMRRLYKMLPQRKNHRLRGFDYRSNVAYFVTICTHDRRFAFGDILHGKLHPTRRGLIAGECWNDLPNHHPHVELDAFVVMPNHVHGILCFVGATPALSATAELQSHSLGTVIGSYKSAVTRRINQLRPQSADNLWQRGYYDRVSRNDCSYETIWQYVDDNPRCWDEDEHNPQATRPREMIRWLETLTAPAGDAGVAPTKT